MTAASREATLAELTSSGRPPLVEAMMRPAFYPHAPKRVELVETHISWVLIAGELVYKVKKPVVFPFLDYGTLERRRQMCEEELRLGKRLAPGLYLGVRAITRDDEGYVLAEAGAEGACEYAVELRRFREERTLASLLKRGEAGTDEIRAVAERLARFHAEAEVAPESFRPSAVAATVGENFGALLDFPGAVDERALHAGHRFAIAFLHSRRGLLERRAGQGHVRDCHGDLRAEHVILDGEVQVFDPIEFDPALRRIDVAAELAFLVMDLEVTGRPDLGRQLLDAYRREGGDPGPDALLYFYAAYRAWVRAKVAVLRAQELQPADPARACSLHAARRLAVLAHRLAWRARRPLTLIVCGGSATGKTYLARELSALSGLPHLNSDVVRKQLAGLAPGERAPDECYTTEFSLRTYRELGKRAKASPDREGGAIVDGTFRRRVDREAFAAGFGRHGERLLFVECQAPAGLVAARAKAREAEAGRVTDAGPDIVERQQHEFEPLDEVPPSSDVVVRTDRSLEEIVDDLESALDARVAA